MKRLLQRCYFVLESMMMRSPAYQLLLVVALLVLLALSGGLAFYLSSPEAGRSFSESVWWALLRLTDPGYLGSDRGATRRLVSLALTVSGSVIFLGALIAIMTTWLDRLLAFLSSGRSPIFERDHILIIGWNERTRALVEELANASERLLLDGRRPAIVILCERFEAGARSYLLQRLKPEVRRRSRLLIRAGDPLEAESLMRVDFSNARSVILLAQPTADSARRQLSDVSLAKILMTLKSRAPEVASDPPSVVVEVSSPANKLLLETLGWQENTESVVGSEFLGRLFCQTIRFPGLSRVYRRLLTDTFTDSVILSDARSIGAHGRPLRELVGGLEAGIPIGCLPVGGRQGDLRLLALDHVLTEDDRLVLVVPGSRSVKGAALPDTVYEEAAAWRTDPVSQPATRAILCVGLGSFLKTFLAELCQFKTERFEVTLVWDTECDAEREQLETLAADAPNLRLTFVRGRLADEIAAAKIAPERVDTIVLLADQRKDALLADAETILHFVLLDRFYAARSLSVAYVVELHDEDNRALISRPDVDIVMSAEVVSHLLAQVAMQRSLAWIYEELFTRGGSELRLREVISMGLPTIGRSFQRCQQICLAHNSIAVGVLRQDGVIVQPSSSEPIQDDDHLVVVEWE